MNIEVSGWHSYKGTTILQHEKIEQKLEKLFFLSKPSQVLEIGTSYGGLSLMIRDVLDKVELHSSKFRTYDVMETNRYWLEEAIKSGADIDFRIKNVFNQPYSDLLEEHTEEIREYIQRDGVTIVMCDGGSKKNEVNILSKFLKPGDVIMAHDYAPNSQYFEEHINNRVWNWHEIQDSHIEDVVNKYSLEPYLQEDFQEVVWVCKKKK
jgi:predicted O-methyltransferase YrrM